MEGEKASSKYSAGMMVVEVEEWGYDGMRGQRLDCGAVLVVAQLGQGVEVGVGKTGELVVILDEEIKWIFHVGVHLGGILGWVEIHGW